MYYPEIYAHSNQDGVSETAEDQSLFGCHNV